MDARAQQDFEPGPGQRLGTGRGVAALFNGRAKQVTAEVVEQFREALPEALILISHDADEALRHAKTIAASQPRLLLSGGGDGAAIMLLNLMRQVGVQRLPDLGVLRLGTGNAWSRSLGAGYAAEMADLLPRLRWPLPTQRFGLAEVEGQLCHFAGVGWDARILNDYKKNLQQLEQMPVLGRRLRRFGTGLPGYLLSLGRFSVPREVLLARHRPRCTVEVVEGPAFQLAPNSEPLRVEGPLLYEGEVSICAVSTIPEFGYSIRAFPYAASMPGLLNLRVYANTIFQALGEVPLLWRGKPTGTGMFDFFARKLRVRCDPPLPFQIGGDAAGERAAFEATLAQVEIHAVDWSAARARAG